MEEDFENEGMNSQNALSLADENQGTDLKNETAGEEIEMGVPDENGEEKNEARQLNIGNVFAAIIIAVIVIVGAILILAKPKKKAASEEELSKAGTKYIPEMRIKESAYEEPQEADLDAKNVDEILETLPPSFQPQSDPEPAPVAPVGSSRTSGGGSYRERPDTRNSRSPRKVEGIAGQDYSMQDMNNKNIVAAVMSGQNPQSYQTGYGTLPSKEDYVQQIMSQSGALAGRSSGNYGNYNTSQSAQANKESFFGNSFGGGSGSGQYLSWGALWEGTVISGALQTAINTDNPGIVIARVTENVYSSYDHSFLLIPEGTLLYATYNSSVSYGQNKVQVAWNLMIRPDGYKVQLGNMNGVNAQGVSGYKGRVNNHPFETLKALGLVAIYSFIQTEMAQEVKGTNNPYLQNAMQDTYSEVSKIGAKIVDRALDIKPTITIKQGTEIKLITNQTLELPPVQVNPVTRKYVRK